MESPYVTDFLLVINCKFSRICHRFRDIQAWRKKTAYFTHPSLVWRPRSGNPLEFLDETYSAKTREMGLPYGENFVVLTSTRQTDGRTDRRFAIAYMYMLSRVKLSLAALYAMTSVSASDLYSFYVSSASRSCVCAYSKDILCRLVYVAFSPVLCTVAWQYHDCFVHSWCGNHGNRTVIFSSCYPNGVSYCSLLLLDCATNV